MHPLDRATASAPPTVGEGCTARYDPEAMDSALGTDFPDAQALWQALQPPVQDPCPGVPAPLKPAETP